MADGLITGYLLASPFPRRRESSEINTPQSGQSLGSAPLMERLAIRLSWQKTPAKSLVIRGDYSINWIPAFAGMTLFRSNESGLNPYRALFFLLAFHAAPTFAEELSDPTQPPASLVAPVIAPASGAVASQPAGLQSIIISKTRRAAIIDGETVELGGKYGDAKLIEVNEGSVVLRSAQGQQVMTLFPDVKITGKQEIKIKPQLPAGEALSGKQKPAAHKERK